MVISGWWTASHCLNAVALAEQGELLKPWRYKSVGIINSRQSRDPV